MNEKYCKLIPCCRIPLYDFSEVLFGCKMACGDWFASYIEAALRYLNLSLLFTLKIIKVHLSSQAVGTRVNGIMKYMQILIDSRILSG